MKFLFIHAHVTLEYFNFKRKNEFKRFVVYFYCFSDKCWLAIAVGNEIDPYLNRHDHSFKFGLARSLRAFLLRVLINTTSKTPW